MTKVKSDALYLFEHFKQSGENREFVTMLFNRIVKTENLKLWEASALQNEFNKLLKASKWTTLTPVILQAPFVFYVNAAAHGTR